MKREIVVLVKGINKVKTARVRYLTACDCPGRMGQRLRPWHVSFGCSSCTQTGTKDLRRNDSCLSHSFADVPIKFGACQYWPYEVCLMVDMTIWARLEPKRKLMAFYLKRINPQTWLCALASLNPRAASS